MPKLPLSTGMLVSRSDCALYQSYTFWICGCHLRCPFCHNWRVAERKENCVDVVANAFAERLSWLKSEQPFTWRFTDCIHFTGGEPLLYPQSPKWLGIVAERAESLGKWVSVNSSLTVSPKRVDALLNTPVRHVAFDLKWPFAELTGMPSGIAEKLWSYFVKNVRTVIDAGLETEMRIPVSTLLTPEVAKHITSEVLDGRKVDVVVVRPLVSKGVGNIEPRNPDWPYYKGPRLTNEEKKKWREAMKEFAKKRIVIFSW